VDTTIAGRSAWDQPKQPPAKKSVLLAFGFFVVLVLVFLVCFGVQFVFIVFWW